MEAITWTKRGMGIVGNDAMKCNNPGGILRSPYREWRGEPDSQTHPELVQFKSAFWGLVALSHCLGQVQKKRGIGTIPQLLSHCYKHIASDMINYVLLANQQFGGIFRRTRFPRLVNVFENSNMLDLMASVVRWKCNLTKTSEDYLPYGYRTMQAACRQAWPIQFPNELKQQVKGEAQ